MRSGHSLAFQQFEDVLSEISIKEFTEDKNQLRELIKGSSQPNDSHYIAPFSMEWSAESDWEPDDPSEVSSGTCIIIPLKEDDEKGFLIRSLGYAESQMEMSSYEFLSDGTFILKTQYGWYIGETLVTLLTISTDDSRNFL